MKVLMSLISFFLTIGVCFYQAMVFMLFFNWFVATTFDLHLIGYWLSLALILTVNVLRAKKMHRSLLHYESNKMDDEDKWVLDIANCVGIFIALNFVLFAGWLIHLNIH